MSSPRQVPFEKLCTAALHRGDVLCSGHDGQLSGEPLSALLHGGNQGGFRFNGQIKGPKLNLVGLFSTLKDADWPDRFEPDCRRFVYYGDNKKAWGSVDGGKGPEVHQTSKHGNDVLREMHLALHELRFRDIPPVFLFSKGPASRDARFEGLAVPGAIGLGTEEGLQGVWRQGAEGWFFNYRSIFTVLPDEEVTAAFIQARLRGEDGLDEAPATWRRWTQEGWAGIESHEPLARPWAES